MLILSDQAAILVPCCLSVTTKHLLRWEQRMIGPDILSRLSFTKCCRHPGQTLHLMNHVMSCALPLVLTKMVLMDRDGQDIITATLDTGYLLVPPSLWFWLIVPILHWVHSTQAAQGWWRDVFICLFTLLDDDKMELQWLANKRPVWQPCDQWEGDTGSADTRDELWPSGWC